MKKATLFLSGVLALGLALSIAGVVMAASQSTTASVSVSQFLSITLSNTPVDFGNMNPGEGPINANTNQGYPLIVTVGNESNIDASISARANNPVFASGSDTFPVSRMEWSSTGAGSWTAYSTSDATVCAPVSPGGSCNIYHRISIPPGQAAGSYSVGITISAA